MRSSWTPTKSSPRSQQLEKNPRAATKTQHSQKERKKERIRLLLLPLICLSDPTQGHTVYSLPLLCGCRVKLYDYGIFQSLKAGGLQAKFSVYLDVSCYLQCWRILHLNVLIGAFMFQFATVLTSPYGLILSFTLLCGRPLPPTFDSVTHGEHEEEVFWNQKWSELESTLLLAARNRVSGLASTNHSFLNGRQVAPTCLPRLLQRLSEIVPSTVLGTGRDLGNINSLHDSPISSLKFLVYRSNMETEERKISEMKELGE